MVSIENYLTEIYVYVDDFFQANAFLSQGRRSNNSQPRFTDAEVITNANQELKSDMQNQWVTNDSKAKIQKPGL